MIYVENTSKKIIISKDLIGRRSLLFALTKNGLILSSVSA
jgi:asparagine synthetase B (glutamine-hydrolysing)